MSSTGAFVNFGDTLVIKYHTDDEAFIRKDENNIFYLTTDTTIPIAVFQLRTSSGSQKETNTRDLDSNVVQYNSSISLGVFLDSTNDDNVRNYFVCTSHTDICPPDGKACSSGYWSSDYNCKRVMRGSSNGNDFNITLGSDHRNSHTSTSRMKIADTTGNQNSNKLTYGAEFKINQDDDSSSNAAYPWVNRNNKLLFGPKESPSSAFSKTLILRFYRYGCTIGGNINSQGFYGSWCADCIMKDWCGCQYGRQACDISTGKCESKCFEDDRGTPKCEGSCSEDLLTCMGECREENEAEICGNHVCSVDNVCVACHNGRDDADNGFLTNCLTGMCSNNTCVNCLEDNDCYNTVCDQISGKCIQCTEDDQCVGICENSRCIGNCKEDADCDGFCDQNFCTGGCKNDADCIDGQKCKNDICTIGSSDNNTARIIIISFVALAIVIFLGVIMHSILKRK